MLNETKTRKVGTNKGTPRVWLEGRLLDDAGFTARTRYSAKLNRKTIVLTLDPAGKYGVSGKNITTDYRMPIIDLHREELTNVLKGCEHVTVNYRDGCITIRPVEANNDE